ncbi:hypothetical protein ACPVPU_04660 [Sphingomonas sp. CJ99]
MTAGLRFPPGAPTHLPPPSRPLALFITLLWSALLALTLIAQGVGTWRSWIEQTIVVEPATAIGIGTSPEDPSSPYWPGPPFTATTGIDTAFRITAVGGQPVGPDASHEAIGRLLLAQPRLVVIQIEPDGAARRTVTIDRNAAEPGFAIDMRVQTLMIMIGGWIAAIALILCSVLLRIRRPRDPVSILMSLAMLAAANNLEMPYTFYWYVGHPAMLDLMFWLFMILLTVALPAFPDGRFVPRWAGWVCWVLPFYGLLAILNTVRDDWDVPQLPGGILTAMNLYPLAIITVSVIARYRGNQDPLMRQQLKWALFGTLGALAINTASVAFMDLLFDNRYFTEYWRGPLSSIARTVLQLGFTVLAVGFLMSLLRYRLWDADAALGRSAVFATLTLALGLIATVSAKLFEIGIEHSFGDFAKPAIAVISTLSAALVLGPARTRANRWMEQRLQPERIRLRKLPRLVQIWQHGDSAAELGDRVTGELKRLLHADRAALLVPDGSDGGYRVLAVRGTDSATVMAWADALDQSGGLPWTTGSDRRDPLFPVRSLVSDGDRLIALLLLGPRSDGSLFGTHELEALEALETPLAVALRHAERTEAHARALDARLARLEAAVARP